MEPIVEGHAINAYVFCPRRCYYEYVEKVFYHNVYTTHGKILHDHVDKHGQEKREENMLFRSLYLHSEKLGVSVRCDVVEETNEHLYPVEYKRGNLSDWENNELQLCVQAMLLEEKLQQMIPFGYLFFYGSYHRKKVILNAQLKKRTLEVIEEIRCLYDRSVPPAGIDEWKRCKKCSLVDYCLPQERQKLKGTIQWERFI